MILNFSFSGQVLLLSIFVFLLLIFFLIMITRRYLQKRKNWHIDHPGKQSKKVRKGIRKYREMDVFQYSSIFFKVGLVLVLALTIVAFNWTSYDKQIDIPEDALLLDEEIEIEPPRTDVPPPPPPPPAPPSAIQEVPDEVELEEEVEFADQSVTEETRIDYTPPEPTAKKVVPPPPPPPAEEPEEIFKIVEEMPRFPGCEDVSGDKAAKKACSDKKLMEYIYANIKYPQVARENGIEGTVVIQFVVGTEGGIEDAKILKDIGGGCGNEALRVVNLMESKAGKWIPGEQRGRKVKVYFMLPIKFKLE